MALFDLKNIKKNIQKSADDLKKTVSDVADNLPDNVKNINVGDSVKDAARFCQRCSTYGPIHIGIPGFKGQCGAWR